MSERYSVKEWYLGGGRLEGDEYDRAEKYAAERGPVTEELRIERTVVKLAPAPLGTATTRQPRYRAEGGGER